MKKINGTIIVLILIITAACGPTQSDLAIRKIAEAEKLVNKGDTATALLKLDSIPHLYPEAVLEAKNVAKFSNRLRAAQLIGLNEQFSKASNLAKTLTANFIPDKGEFEKYTNYTFKSQGLDKNWSRSFLQAVTNEAGNYVLISNYYGADWINHTSVILDGEGLIATTDTVPLDHPNSHHSEFNGSKWERVTYQEAPSEKVAQFIASHPDKKLKVCLRSKGKYVVWLEDTDRKAILATWELAKAFKAQKAAKEAIVAVE